MGETAQFLGSDYFDVSQFVYTAGAVCSSAGFLRRQIFVSRIVSGNFEVPSGLPRVVPARTDTGIVNIVSDTVGAVFSVAGFLRR